MQESPQDLPWLEKNHLEVISMHRFYMVNFRVPEFRVPIKCFAIIKVKTGVLCFYLYWQIIVLC